MVAILWNSDSLSHGGKAILPRSNVSSLEQISPTVTMLRQFPEQFQRSLALRAVLLDEIDVR